MRLVLAGLIIVFSASLGFGQKTSDEPKIIEAKSFACEQVPADLGYIIFQTSNKKEKIIAVFRAGKNETEIVNANRLAYVKWYLETHKRWPPVIIYTRGEKSENGGKIEFYVNGKLPLVIMSPHNMTPCLDCCGNLIDYPQRLIKNHRSGKQK